MKPHPYTIRLDESERHALYRLLSTPGINRSLYTRAFVFKLLDDGLSAPQIVKLAGVARSTVYALSQRYKDSNLKNALYDGRRSGTPRLIPLAAFDWVAGIARKEPRIVGVNLDHWTFTELQAYVRREGPLNGFPELANLSRSYLWRIIRGHPLRPSDEMTAENLASVSRSEPRMILRQTLSIKAACIGGLWQLAPEPNAIVVDGRHDESVTHGGDGRNFELFHFMVGFDSGSSRLHVIQGTGRTDDDMVSWLGEIDRSIPTGVMIELMDLPDVPNPSPVVTRHLFSKAGRFSLVRNRHSESLARMKAMSKGILFKTRPFHSLKANSPFDLASQILAIIKAYRVPEHADEAAVSA